MEPINIFKKVITCACALLAALSSGGCTKEDLSDCGVLVQFKYTRNIDGVDKFPAEIDNISLYVFDGDGIFVGEYHDQGEHLDEAYRMQLNLSNGTYSLIAWSGCRESCYEVTAFTPGVTTLADAVLSLKCASGTVDTYPSHLYHGWLEKVAVKGGSNGRQRLAIDMMKNTNTIRVINKGLLSESGVGSFSCQILSTNADYKFDNSIATGSRRLKYIPQNSKSDGYPTFDFRVLRECDDNRTSSELVVTYHTPEGVDKTESIPLVPLLKRALKTTSLDLQDYFELEVEVAFDYTYGKITITINDWKYVPGGGMVG